jgi:hypothetical protein
MRTIWVMAARLQGRGRKPAWVCTYLGLNGRAFAKQWIRYRCWSRKLMRIGKLGVTRRYVERQSIASLLRATYVLYECVSKRTVWTMAAHSSGEVASRHAHANISHALNGRAFAPWPRRQDFLQVRSDTFVYHTSLSCVRNSSAYGIRRRLWS